jgi:hypothetical protein
MRVVKDVRVVRQQNSKRVWIALGANFCHQ